jgi:Arc/MetJ family transcription regulator
MHYHLVHLHHRSVVMRTTLDLDEDVLASAKEIARRENKTAGQVLSELARRALTQGAAAPRSAKREPVAVHGFKPFAARGAVVTNALIEKLRDEGEY